MSDISRYQHTTTLKSIINKKSRQEKIAFGLMRLCSFLIILILTGIIGNILINGLPYITVDFLTTEPKDMGRAGGVASVIITTLYLIILSLIIATPIGIGSAIFLTEYAKEGKIIKIIRFCTEALAGIPSIIFGLFGYVFFVVFLDFKYSMVSGSLTLSLMILPIIIRTSEEAIKAVPRSYREGSQALGATKWYTIYKIVLPTATPGIMTGIILGIGRIVGETAAVIYTAGSSLGIPNSIWRPGRTLAVHLYILASEGLSKSHMYATATVLIIIVLIINLIVKQLLGRLKISM